MKIRNKLVSGFLVVAVLAALAGGVGIYAFMGVSGNISRMEEALPWLFASFRLKELSSEGAQAITRFLTVEDPDTLRELEEEFASLVEAVEMYEGVLLEGSSFPDFSRSGRHAERWRQEEFPFLVEPVPPGSELAERIAEVATIRGDYQTVADQVNALYRERLALEDELFELGLALDRPIAVIEGFMRSLAGDIDSYRETLGAMNELMSQFAVSAGNVPAARNNAESRLSSLEAVLGRALFFSEGTREVLSTTLKEVEAEWGNLLRVMERDRSQDAESRGLARYQNYRKLQASIRRLNEEIEALRLDGWLERISQMSLARKNYFLASPENRDFYQRLHDTSARALEEFFAEDFLSVYDEERAEALYRDTWGSYDEMWSEAAKINDRLMQLRQEEREALEHMQELQASFSASLDEFNRIISDDFRSRVDAIHATRENMQWMLYLTTIIVLVVAVVLGLLLSASLVRPLNRGVAYAEVLASGDLTGEVDGTRKDEAGQLLQSLNTASRSLRAFMRDVSESAGRILEGVEELKASSAEVAQTGEHIAQTVSQVSQGSEEQSRNLGEISDKMESLVKAVRQVSDQLTQQVEGADYAFAQVEKITGSIVETAESVNETYRRTEKSAESTRKGQETLGGVSEAMRSIQESVVNVSSIIDRLGEGSREIGKITDLITGIADETNLLALNAAIEAARAGDAGRGFAVVAQEVRKLAEESAQAARRISGLIEDIQKESSLAVSSMKESTTRVNRGVEAVEEAGQAFETITALSDRMGEEMERISGSFQTIKEASRQVGDALKSMVEISRSSHASVEEADTMSEEVSEKLAGVASISEQNAASTEEVAAGSEEQSAALQDMRKTIENISHKVQVLQKDVGKFKV